MSRVGKKPIDIPSGVMVAVQGSNIAIKGPKGESSKILPSSITAKVEGGKVIIGRHDDSRLTRSLHGLYRTLVVNMFEGVTKGYTRELEIEGVGFKALLLGKKLMLSVGFSSPIEYEVPDDVKVSVDGNTKVMVSGIDKQKVGEAAAEIRAVFPPEPYKGKGIRYKGEYVRRKVGKTVA